MCLALRKVRLGRPESSWPARVIKFDRVQTEPNKGYRTNTSMKMYLQS